jgi:hypothetical protein
MSIIARVSKSYGRRRLDRQITLGIAASCIGRNCSLTPVASQAPQGSYQQSLECLATDAQDEYARDAYNDMATASL